MKTRLTKLRILSVCALFSLTITFSFSQTSGVVRCYTDEQDAFLRANHPELESHAQFEQWIQSEMNANAANGKIIGGVYQIPVVFHVIHNGEAVGSGTNVSYAAIQSQIDVLNEDFRRIFGTNGWNTNPVGADTQIEFCLAKRRPDGSAFPNGEDGVNRINRSTAGFTTPPFTTNYIDATIKTWTYNGGTATATRGWIPSKYMNIWLCNISGGILGYAQFPQSPIGGMGCGTPVTATDGVVFAYNSIGKSAVTGFAPPYNEGRTATHEIGHWLGLRHIWGDGGCNATDYCNDTPTANGANYNCPVGQNSCTAAPDQGPDMVQNYMDYTNDLCMNIFTNDQKQRMRAVLEGSPLRVSLINSDACTPPNSVDASIVDVFNPKGDHCAGAITPSVQLKNRGSNNLTSASISYQVDNGTPVTFSWTGNLAPNATATVTLPAFTAPLGNHTFRAYSTLPNGVIDPFPGTDTSGIDFAVSNGIMPNYTQDFEGGSFPPDVRWYLDNVNGDCFKWSPASGMSSTGTFTNNMAQMPCFGNSSTSNEDLYSPVFLLPCNATAATFKFDVAYRKRISSSNDQLIVQISTNCGTSWTNVYSKSGNVSPFLYQNATLLGSEYFPSAASDWRTETIDLMPYVGTTSKNIRFRFRAVSANGNNIYIDNIKFEGTTPGEVNISVAGVDVLDGGYYTYNNTQVGGSSTQTFTVSNTGTTNLVLSNPITVTGAGFALGTGFGTTTITPGSSTTFTVVFSPTAAGSFTGNVSFSTNDCDEGTYNFQLNGLGVVSNPVADFSASPTTLCQGATTTFTNLSTFSTSYSWSFPGGTPATSTATNPTVTYNTAGTYAVTLVATNANGSDTETKTAYITVIASSASALPLTEGFTSAAFVPAGWSLTNNNSSPTTWARTTSAGVAPSTGNAMWFNNYAYNDGDDDMVNIKPLIFSNLSSAQLTFDVAYAPYNAANFDGLEVLVSTDCAVTFTSVYSKSYTTLATAAATTNAFTPTAAQWRNETVDLTPFVGQPNVMIAFKNLSGYGNNLYVDNINVSGVAASVPPTASFNATTTSLCVGQTVSYTSTSTGNPTSYLWSFPGGTPSTSTAQNPTVTYASSGNYTVELTVTNGAGSNTLTQSNYVTVNALPATPTIASGGPTTFCAGGSVTLTSSSGNSYLWSNGATTQAISPTTSGTYSVQVTNASGCQSTASASVPVTVNPLPSAPTISNSGATTFCAGGSVTLTSTSGNGYLWSTGATTQSITVTTAGTYTCKVISAAGCQSVNSNSITVTVNPLPSAPTISNSGATTFCAGGSVTLTSSSGNSYLWSNGATTQAISPTTSGTYSVQVTNASGCQSTASASVPVSVNPLPSAPTISNSGATTFCAGGSVTLTSTAGNGYLWSTGATTQSITVTTAGTYTCKVISAAGCQSVNSNAIPVTVNPLPSAPTISNSGATTFCTGGSVTLTSTTGNGYLWSTGATTQSITVTTAGTYTCKVISAAGCQSVNSNAISVTVNPTPTISVGTVTNPTSCATSTGSIQITGTGTGTLSWSGTATGSNTITSLPATISNVSAGSYQVILTNAAGCASPSISVSLTDPGAPVPPVITNTGTLLCIGDSIELTSSYASGNLWSNGATTESIFVSTAGTYTVSATNAGCTSISNAIQITQTNPFSVNAGIDQTICVGSSVTLTATSIGLVTLVWNNSIQDGVAFNPTASDIYEVTATDANGCTLSDQVQVTVNNNPIVTFDSISPLCTYNPAITLSGGLPLGGTYSGTGVVAGSFDPALSGAGSFPMTYTFTDGNGCVGSAQSTIVVDACLSIEENESWEVALYPNPSTGLVKIHSTINYAKVSVFDTQGKLIWKQVQNESELEKELDFSTFSNGHYTIQLEGDLGVIHLQFVIAK